MSDESLKPRLKLIISPQTEANLMEFEFEFEFLFQGKFTIQDYEHNKQELISAAQSVLKDANFKDKVLQATTKMVIDEVKSKSQI